MYIASMWCLNLLGTVSISRSFQNSRRLFMKPVRCFGLILAATLMVPSFVSAPAFAQGDQAAALDKRYMEVYRAGKFSEAVPLAQQALAIREKALGPDHPDVAAWLNGLANL